jgi:hypothetical protein
MKLRSSVPLLLAALATAGPAVAGNFMSSNWNSKTDQSRGGAYFVREAPDLVGPYGQPIQAVTPASYQEPTGADYARYVLTQSMPQQMLMQAGYNQPPCGPNNCGPAGGYGGPAMGQPLGPAGAPPIPSLGPSGAAVNSANYNGPPGAVAAVGTLGGPGGPPPGPVGPLRTEVRFVGPPGMQISWFAPRPDGRVGFTTEYLEAPARYNFLQASIYRLKLSDIPGRPGVTLYPTLEIVPCNAKTATFLAHSAVPIKFTEEDFEQVAVGNFIVKVIYLPDPQFQDLAAVGPDEVVSSRLEPGVDPLVEAKRRGSILAVVRLGDINLEAPNTPAMDAPPMVPRPGGGPANNFVPPNNVAPPAMGMMRPMVPPATPPNTFVPPVQTGPVPVNTNAPPIPAQPQPLRPDVKGPATPLSLSPAAGQLQPVSATTTATTSTAAATTTDAPKVVKPPQRGTLMDWLGKPTTSR